MAVDMRGLTEGQKKLLFLHDDDTDQIRNIMADRIRKVNRMKLDLPIGCDPDLIDEALKENN